jgi:hypothetical protein
MEPFVSPAISDGGGDFSLVVGGPLYRLYLWTHLSETSMGLAHRRIGAFLLIAWAPLWLLTLLDGSTRTSVAVSLARDVDAHMRFLIALPLLILGEPIVHERVRVTVRQFIACGLIDRRGHRRFVAAVSSGMTMANSAILEVVVLAVAVVVGHWVWTDQVKLHVVTWYKAPGTDGSAHLTLAGRWYVLVSLPIFRFLLFRWYVRLVVVWYRFLWAVSRIPLRLNALHPDRNGGLGFLDTTVFAFIPMLVAQTALLSAVFAERIWNEGATLAQFQLEILAIVMFLMVLVLLPQTFFAPQIERAWRKGLYEYGVLSSRYVDGFRQKWLSGPTRSAHGLMGSSDIQSLADLGNAFQNVVSMSLVPISRNTLVRLALAITAPLMPLILTAVPFSAVITRAIGAIV